MTSRSGTTAHSAPSAQMRALDGPETIIAPIAVAAIACEKTVGIHFTSRRAVRGTTYERPLEASMIRPRLLEWQWSDYSAKHRDRINLAAPHRGSSPVPDRHDRPGRRC